MAGRRPPAVMKGWLIGWLCESLGSRTAWERQGVASNYLEQQRRKAVIPLWCLLCYDSRISTRCVCLGSALDSCLEARARANYIAETNPVLRPHQTILRWAGDLSSVYSSYKLLLITTDLLHQTTHTHTQLVTCLVCMCTCVHFLLGVYEAYRRPFLKTNPPIPLVGQAKYHSRPPGKISPVANLHLDVAKMVTVWVWDCTATCVTSSSFCPGCEREPPYVLGV